MATGPRCEVCAARELGRGFDEPSLVEEQRADAKVAFHQPLAVLCRLGRAERRLELHDRRVDGAIEVGTHR